MEQHYEKRTKHILRFKKKGKNKRKTITPKKTDCSCHIVLRFKKNKKFKRMQLTILRIL